MASSGFSAPINYWGTIAGLTPKSSSRGGSHSVATAANALADVVAFDRIGGTLNPTVEFAVTAAFTNQNTPILLGKVVEYTVNNVTSKLMITQVVVRTAAGTPPTITVSGVQVENGATTKRTYPVAMSVAPRSKAQDVATAFSLASVSLNSCETTFSIEPVVQTIGGWPAVHDVTNGKVEAVATIIQATSGGSWGKSDGFDVFMLGDENRQDAAYISRNITSIKYLSGTDAA